MFQRTLTRYFEIQNADIQRFASSRGNMKVTLSHTYPIVCALAYFDTKKYISKPTLTFFSSLSSSFYSAEAKVRRYWKMFTSLTKIIPNLYPEQKNLNKLFTVMGWKFKFSAQDRIEVWNILQYLLT